MGVILSAREAFACFALGERYQVVASANEKEYDFLVDDKKVEIGGKAKGIKNADFILCDDIDFPVKNCIPFWMTSMVF